MARNISSKFGIAEGLDFEPDHAITDIPIDELVAYKKHCFKLYEGERLYDMIQSISKNGVMVPIIVRNTSDGKYEIISGHNRVYAAGLAGLNSVPAVVKTGLSDELAQIFLIETNLMQRGYKELRISEQAFAVAMRYKDIKSKETIEAIEKEISIYEGIKNPVDSCSDKMISKNPLDSCGKVDNLKNTGDEYGLSRATIIRLLRINSLIQDIKNMVDNGNIKIRPAVELSYLSEEMQKMLVKVMSDNNITAIDMKTAKQLRDVSESYANPTEENIADVLLGRDEDTKAQKDKGKKITLPTATYKRYLDKYSAKEANEIIEKALELYFKENADG